MSYRGPESARMQARMAEILRQVGQTATWRQWISASAGNATAGLGNRDYYREQTVMALFYQGYSRVMQERQTPVGQIAAGQFAVSMGEHLRRNDELVWRGIVYRVMSDPQPSRVAGLWMAMIEREDT